MISKDEFQKLAREGASVRYKELQAELSQLLDWFPDLEPVLPGNAFKKDKVLTRGELISLRMKRYWANRKRNEKKLGRKK